MNRDSITEIVKQYIYKMIPEGQHINLKDCIGSAGLGLDSLRYLKLISNVEKKTSIQIDDEKWDYDGDMTIEDVINLFVDTK